MNRYTRTYSHVTLRLYQDYAPPVIMSISSYMLSAPIFGGAEEHAAWDRRMKEKKYLPPILGNATRWQNKLRAAIRRSKRFPECSKKWWSCRREAAIARRRIQSLGHDVMAYSGWPMEEVTYCYLEKKVTE